MKGGIQASSNPGDMVLTRSAAAARQLTPPKSSAAIGSALIPQSRDNWPFPSSKTACKTLTAAG
jgi:hypothetical protein